MTPAGTERAETIRKFMEAFNRRDVDTMVGHLDSDIELHEWPQAPGAASYCGVEGVRRALAAAGLTEKLEEDTT
jgi:limonene-1,2-epoxide hydrolase